ncbi:hypothetical protein [Agrococcus beijingensis]|uniref:hypothetical protein n=1 Tax=Agrococcus beijingensis TaxID=3068634 RepID=UPI0027404622|nr:hypothetical protein [Agrococcus sp. REN33]
MRLHARSLASIAMIVSAAALVACAGTPGPAQPEIPPGITAPPPTTPAQPTEAAPEVVSSLPAEIAGVDTTGWQQIAVPSGAATFRIPPGWSVAPAAGGLDVLRDDGQRQLGYVEAPNVGDGACRDASGEAVAWRTLGLDRQDVALEGAPGLAFGSAGLQLGGQWVMTMGLRPAEAAQRPQCPIVHAVDTPAGTISFGTEVVAQGAGAGAPWAIDSLADAEAYLADPEYATLRAILMSLELL